MSSLFLQQPSLCLIAFMASLNWSSPEDNRSLQCCKLNYRCCEVCSENDCKKGLLSPRQFWWGSYVCPSCRRVAGDRQGARLEPWRGAGCRPRARSSACPARGEPRACPAAAPAWRAFTWAELHAEVSVPCLENVLRFPVPGFAGRAEHVPPGSLRGADACRCTGCTERWQSPRASRGDSRSCVSCALAGWVTVLAVRTLAKELLECPACQGLLCGRRTCSLCCRELASQAFPLEQARHPAGLLPAGKGCCHCWVPSPPALLCLWRTRASLLHCDSNRCVCWLAAMLCFLLLGALL